MRFNPPALLWLESLNRPPAKSMLGMQGARAICFALKNNRNFNVWRRKIQISMFKGTFLSALL